jgi:hypothetical protein
MIAATRSQPRMAIVHIATVIARSHGGMDANYRA